METEKLEARRDEIIGFNKELANQLNAISEEFKALQARATELNTARQNLIVQANINNGAIAEVMKWIEVIKKKEVEVDINKDYIYDNVVDINSKKKK